MSELNLEDSINKLEEISKFLESPDIPLDEAMKNFEEGLGIIKRCNKIINETETKIIDLTESNSSENNHDDEIE